jgi:hypothetical protein
LRQAWQSPFEVVRVRRHRARHEQNEERDEQRRQAEIILVDRTGAKHRSKQEAAQHGAYDADDDVEKHALLCIGTHDDACEPTDDATYDEPDNKVHDFLLSD